MRNGTFKSDVKLECVVAFGGWDFEDYDEDIFKSDVKLECGVAFGGWDFEVYDGDIIISDAKDNQYTFRIDEAMKKN